MNPLSKHAFQRLFVLACLPYASATEFERSDEIAIAGGKMVVAWPIASSKTQVERQVNGELLIHFHGSADVVMREAGRAKIDCPIVVLNFPGLSSAYRRPFEKDRSLFEEVLVQANRELRSVKQVAAGVEGPLVLSSFSAGYGAVRELLRSPKNMNRIQGYVAAYSIYASIVPPASDEQAGKSPRLVEPEHMKDFLALARLSAKGEKFFLLTHSDQPTPYASTTETANYLIDALLLRRENLPSDEKARTKKPSPWLPTSKCNRNGFQVLGYSGAAAEDHLQHLRRIGDAFLRIRKLRARDSLTSPRLSAGVQEPE